MLESDQIRAIVESAEERGFIDPAQIEAFSNELELNDDEVEELTRELERTGLEIGQSAAPAAASHTWPAHWAATWPRRSPRTTRR